MAVNFQRGRDLWSELWHAGTSAFSIAFIKQLMNVTTHKCNLSEKGAC